MSTASAVADPTLRVLGRFADPAAWGAVETAVPVFKPHTRTVTDPATGRPDTFTVGDADLYEIAENVNRRERTSGVPAIVTVGHVKGDLPETEQPPLVGYARNFRVGTFGPSAEPALLADVYILPEYYGLAREYPFRSIEYYRDTQDIGGVALLKRRPFPRPRRRYVCHRRDGGATALLPLCLRG